MLAPDAHRIFAVEQTFDHLEGDELILAGGESALGFFANAYVVQILGRGLQAFVFGERDHDEAFAAWGLDDLRGSHDSVSLHVVGTAARADAKRMVKRSEEHTSELQSL